MNNWCFLFKFNYFLFHSPINCWNHYFFHQLELHMCSYISKWVQIRGRVPTLTRLLCCYPGRLQHWKWLHSLIFFKEWRFRLSYHWTNKMNCELMLTYDSPALRQTGSRNLMGPKTLPTIWGTYMKLVTKYQISAINSYWEKCDEKYLGRTEGQR